MTLKWFAKRFKPGTKFVIIEYVSMRYVATITVEEAMDTRDLFHDMRVIDWDFTKECKVYI